MRCNNHFLRRLVSVLGVMIAAAVSGAACGGDDGVLPPEAKPLGYSLKDAVAAVAAFDVGPRTPATVPDVPFQVLYVLNGPPYPTEATFTVKPGTYLYVPLFFADDSPPIIGDFPDDVRDRWADAEYIFDPDEFGGSFEINVDGKSMWVGPEYVAGAETAALPDGGGTHAIGVAVFLKPLSKGKHKITLNLALEGDAWIAAAGGPAEEVLTYEVIVK